MDHYVLKRALLHAVTQEILPLFTDFEILQRSAAVPAESSIKHHIASHIIHLNTSVHSMSVSSQTGPPFRHLPLRSGITLRFGTVLHHAFFARILKSKNKQATRTAETSERIYQSTRHTH